ncbi:hypothetical protein [Pseudomonas sp. DCB_BG]|uniref:hypothetical protein n=1 Tax=Pseudomonas sp. DCB_BG TaxID=2993595 RepID=UPI0022496E38|nr:hypothetical protein [Pseudomonas sp. DCB_BG]MCX2709675.1 hypothetical protein [Pseudomonas sp. DCB_BG]
MTTLQDLGSAYRKVKVDRYYSSHASLDAIADYEDALHAKPFKPVPDGFEIDFGRKYCRREKKSE